MIQIGSPSFFISRVKYNVALQLGVNNVATKVEKIEVKFKLGVRAHDVITGFEGIITSRIQHITGCDQYHLQPPMDIDSKEYKYPVGEYFDENRLELVHVGVSKIFENSKKATVARPGGPNRDTVNIARSRR